MKAQRILIGVFAFLCACQTLDLENSALVTSDAENFAKLIENGKIPNAELLQRQYLNVGTKGVEIFTEDRIKNAENLAANVSANIADYRHAVTTCLPIARSMRSEISQVLNRAASLLGETETAPTYVLFGAGNSGGTAKAEGLAIGLEVVCKSETSATFSQTLKSFVAHEITHVYQSRHASPNPEVDLLYFALAEGGADFVAQLATGVSLADKSAYGAYGLAHETEIWQDFKTDWESHIQGGGDWFYRAGRNGRPNDLGYFVGRRISEEYYARAADKTQALRNLIELKNPRQILADSHYDELRKAN